MHCRLWAGELLGRCICWEEGKTFHHGLEWQAVVQHPCKSTSGVCCVHACIV